MYAFLCKQNNENAYQIVNSRVILQIFAAVVVFFFLCVGEGVFVDNLREEENNKRFRDKLRSDHGRRSVYD